MLFPFSFPNRVMRGYVDFGTNAGQSKSYSSTLRRKIYLLEPGRRKDAATGSRPTNPTQETTQTRHGLREHRKAFIGKSQHLSKNSLFTSTAERNGRSPHSHCHKKQPENLCLEMLFPNASTFSSNSVLEDSGL